MKHLIVFCFLFFVQQYSAGQDLSCNDLSGMEEKTLALHHLKFAWMKSGELDSLSRMMDDNIRYIHSNGWEETKEEVISNLLTKKLIYHDILVESCYARKYNNVVIITGQGTFKVSLEGTYIEIKLKYTETYACLNGEVRMINRHANKLN